MDKTPYLLRARDNRLRTVGRKWPQARQRKEDSGLGLITDELFPIASNLSPPERPTRRKIIPQDARELPTMNLWGFPLLPGENQLSLSPSPGHRAGWVPKVCAQGDTRAFGPLAPSPIPELPLIPRAQGRDEHTVFRTAPEPNPSLTFSYLPDETCPALE